MGVHALEQTGDIGKSQEGQGQMLGSWGHLERREQVHIVFHQSRCQRAEVLHLGTLAYVGGLRQAETGPQVGCSYTPRYSRPEEQCQPFCSLQAMLYTMGNLFTSSGRRKKTMVSRDNQIGASRCVAASVRREYLSVSPRFDFVICVGAIAGQR